MNPFRLLLGLLILATSFTALGQSQVDGETSFLFFLKIYNKDLNETVKKAGSGETSWWEFYAQGVDKNNFEVTKNDEFKRSKYIVQTKDIITKKINGLSFKTEYYIISESEFGEYDFPNNSFPITSIFQGQNYRGLTLANPFKVPIKIGWIINQNDFEYRIKLSADKAETFINTRKNTSGYIDRKIETRIFFTFVNQPLYNGKGVSMEHSFKNTELITYITRVEFYNNGQKLYTLLPTIKFEDPISGFKTLNGQETYHINETYDGQTIVVNRVNGIPNGPVNYYNSKNNSLERTINCSYFFPTVIKLSGDDVKFTVLNNKPVPYSITQYNNNRTEGYDLKFEISNNLIILYVTKFEKNGEKKIIYAYNVLKEMKKVKDMPTDVQELIKKYDYGNYFTYSTNNSSTDNFNKTTNYDDRTTDNKNAKNDANLNSTSELNKILFSTYRGDVAKDYLSGNIGVYTNKKSKIQQPTDIIFMFINKDDEIPYQNELIEHISNWVKDNVKLSTTNSSTIKSDALFKIELGFAEKFHSSITGGETFWYADLMTNIILTKNGILLKKDTFLNSTAMFSGKQDKWIALEDAIIKCEKKIGKILENYITIE